MVSSIVIPIHVSAQSKVEVTTKQCLSKRPLEFREECKSEADEWGNELFSLWNKLAPQVEKDIVRGYTMADYSAINGYLRSNFFEGLDQAKIEKSIKHMDKAFSRVRLFQDTIVYRRVSERAFGLQNGDLINDDSKINMDRFEGFKTLFQGKMKKDPAYMSTSIMKDVAGGFSELPILMKIHVPQGVPAMYLAPLSNFPDEMELLLPRNRTYKVTNISPVTEKISEKDEEGKTIERDREYVLVDIDILDIPSNYREKRSLDNKIFEDRLPSLSK
ncbi:ADP-ribosyltransferase [Thermoactinomyces sp. DSM 45892]|uniref:ADP-ribosyltransferase n=1 Tax=Thermoactinomyces sp. DSM 45892 TaxID=1882753 RepID=UPI002101B873|nr:ADP-ribosyltransferase [Thermoactinomyces sp. DSM 45892]